MSWLSKAFKKVYREIGRLGGNDPHGNWGGWGAVPSAETQKIEADRARRNAEIEAQRKQHLEEVEALGRAGMENIVRRRRKGVYSTLLTGGQQTAYASPTLSGTKTLLSQ